MSFKLLLVDEILVLIRRFCFEESKINVIYMQLLTNKALIIYKTQQINDCSEKINMPASLFILTAS